MTSMVSEDVMLLRYCLFICVYDSCICVCMSCISLNIISHS